MENVGSVILQQIFKHKLKMLKYHKKNLDIGEHH